MEFDLRPAIGAAMATVLLLSACTTSTPYQPQSMLSPVSGGYSDQRLGQDHYSVTFAGNTLTSRERVESYLLFRAAELTRERGADWFVIVARETEPDAGIVVRADRPLRTAEPEYRPRFSAVYGEWRPYWDYQTPDHGWRAWDPYGDDPFWADEVEPAQLESFSATAEIRLGRGPVPLAEAMNAHEVIAEIGPSVEYPED